MFDVFSLPWPWYVAGPLVGLFVPALLVQGNRQFGISSNLRHLCAAVAPARVEFLRYDWNEIGTMKSFPVATLSSISSRNRASLTPSENDTSCYWRVKDADQFYQEFAVLDLLSEGIPRLTAPVDQPWGMREFTLVDPSGNLLRVGHDLDADAAYVPQDSQR